MNLTNTHYPLECPIKSWVNIGLMNGDLNTTEPLRACKIIGLSSYKGATLTFQILLANEEGILTSIWSDVPLHLIFHSENGGEGCLDLADLAYHNCPDNNIEAVTYNALSDSKCECYFPRLDRWISGIYVTTIDWYKGNLTSHLIKLNNGNFALVPNHKIQFGSESNKLPKFMKQRFTWEI